MNHYSVLIPTLRTEWLLKTTNKHSTNMQRSSPQRNQGADIIYIYQEILDYSVTITQDSRPFPPRTFLPPMISEAIQNAAKFYINLSPGSLVQGDGNCAFAAVIGNVNSRPCFQRKISLTQAQARYQW